MTSRKNTDVAKNRVSSGKKRGRERKRDGGERRGSAQGSLPRFMWATRRGFGCPWGDGVWPPRKGAFGGSGADALGAILKEVGTALWEPPGFGAFIHPGEVGSPNPGVTASALTTGLPTVNGVPGK